MSVSHNIIVVWQCLQLRDPVKLVTREFILIKAPGDVTLGIDLKLPGCFSRRRSECCHSVDDMPSRHCHRDHGEWELPVLSSTTCIPRLPDRLFCTRVQSRHFRV